MHTIGTIWILSVTFFRMVLLGNSLLQDDQHSDTNRKSRTSCHCAPHPHPLPNKFADPSYNYTYCRQIQETINCLKIIQRNKNCSLDFEMTALQTGSLFQEKKYNCLSVLKRKFSRYSTILPFTTRPNGGSNNGGDNNGPKAKGRCIYKSRSLESLHCGLFGDPHLKTFSDKRQTCVVKGAWSMLNNKYLAVQVTNVLIERNNPVATATSKVNRFMKCLTFQANCLQK